MQLLPFPPALLYLTSENGPRTPKGVAGRELKPWITLAREDEVLRKVKTRAVDLFGVQFSLVPDILRPFRTCSA